MSATRGWPDSWRSRGSDRCSWQQLHHRHFSSTNFQRSHITWTSKIILIELHVVFAKNSLAFFVLLNSILLSKAFLNIKTLLVFNEFLDYNKHPWSMHTLHNQFWMKCYFLCTFKVHITRCQTAEKYQIQTAPVYITELNLKHGTSSTAKHQDQ